jgi:hypothetical protein
VNEVEITTLSLASPRGVLRELRAFYVGQLGLPSDECEPGGLRIRLGARSWSSRL